MAAAAAAEPAAARSDLFAENCWLPETALPAGQPDVATALAAVLQQQQRQDADPFAADSAQHPLGLPGLEASLTTVADGLTGGTPAAQASRP